MSSALLIRPAVAADLDSARQLLQSAGLPVADLNATHLALCAETGDHIQGVIGIEYCGDVALLRSLVISAAMRCAGVGAALVTALEANADAAGVTELWLLTVDADAFFARLGYQRRERADAPVAIQATQEFAVLCPDDAVLMSKRLAVLVET